VFGKEHVLPKIDESGRWENIVSNVGAVASISVCFKFCAYNSISLLSARVHAQSNDSRDTKGRRSECAHYTPRTQT